MYKKKYKLFCLNVNSISGLNQCFQKFDHFCQPIIIAPISRYIQSWRTNEFSYRSRCDEPEEHEDAGALGSTEDRLILRQQVCLVRTRRHQCFFVQQRHEHLHGVSTSVRSGVINRICFRLKIKNKKWLPVRTHTKKYCIQKEEDGNPESIYSIYIYHPGRTYPCPTLVSSPFLDLMNLGDPLLQLGCSVFCCSVNGVSAAASLHQHGPDGRQQPGSTNAESSTEIWAKLRTQTESI